MALDIDVYTVLRAIAAHQSTFSTIRADATRAQGAFTQKLRTLLTKQIKSSAADIAALKEIRKALGGDIFDLVVDGMTDTEIKAVVAKADKHHPEQKTARADWRRKHLAALISGAAYPSEKAVKAKASKPAKAGKKPAAKEPDFLFDESAGAVRKSR